MDWILPTKLQPPALHPHLVPRPHLVDALRREALAHPLTVVTAPAGSGKTTLLISLTAARPDRDVAWLTLEAADSEPVRFFHALLAALRRLRPGLGEQLVRPGLPLIQRMAGLAGELHRAFSEPCLLILDDLHEIADPAVFAGLDYLIEHLPATGHLLVTGRVDPPLSLARFRVRRMLSEWHMEDLRMTLSEAAVLLGDSSGLHLAPHEVAAVYARTDGWPAGLSLVAATLSGAGR